MIKYRNIYYKKYMHKYIFLLVFISVIIFVHMIEPFRNNEKKCDAQKIIQDNISMQKIKMPVQKIRISENLSTPPNSALFGDYENDDKNFITITQECVCTCPVEINMRHVKSCECSKYQYM